MMTQVMIVEDQRIIQEIFETYLQRSEHYCHALTLSGAGRALQACQEQHIDLILMDVCTENDESGFDATAQIKAHFPEIKVIIVTSMLDYTYLDRAREAGADSIWFKESGEADILSVMDRTMAGERIYPDHTPSVRIGAIFSDEFTKAELKVLRLVVVGKTYREIAQELSITTDAVKWHVTNMLSKTGFTSKTQLAAVVGSKRLVIDGF